MQDKPPSQLIKAGGGRGDAVILGPLGVGLAAQGNWGLFLHGVGAAPIFPLPTQCSGNPEDM